MAQAINQDILLDTAQGKPVPNAQATTIALPLAAQALVDKITLPSKLRALPHPRYNCHGLTFASRRTSIHADVDVYHILKDDGYRSIPVAEVLPGDIAIYYTYKNEIDHSAIVVSSPEAPTWTPFVCSKFGVIGPEVIHLATNCDYAIANIQYYRVMP